MHNYQPNDRTALLEPTAEGVRVYEATIFAVDGTRIGMRVGIDGEDRWATVDDQGRALGPEQTFKVIPLDEVLQRDLETQGTGFLLRTTLRDVVQVAENAEEAAAQIEARMQHLPHQGHGYGY